MPSQARTLLSLPRFAELLGLHPLHFMGVDMTQHAASSKYCVRPVYQYSWQNADSVSREEIAYAIAEAEDLITRHLGYPPGPTYYAGERHQYDWVTRLSHGHIISGGVEGKTLVQAGALVAYADLDSDGYKETATVDLTLPAGTVASELAVFLPGNDGAWEWQVRPISATTNAVTGITTITMRREHLLTKAVLTSYARDVVNGDTIDAFTPEVDVYRVWHDPSRQVEFYSFGGGCAYCADAGCQACGLSVETGCMVVTDARLGLVSQAVSAWDSATSRFNTVAPAACYRPNYIKVWYKAGLPTLGLVWELAIARLAITRLDRPVPACEGVSQAMEYWRQDLALVENTAARQRFIQPLDPVDRANPLGTTRAGIHVMNLIRDSRLGVLPPGED